MPVYKLNTHDRNANLDEQIQNLNPRRSYTMSGIKHLVNGDSRKIAAALADNDWLEISWRPPHRARRTTKWIHANRVWIDGDPLGMLDEIP